METTMDALTNDAMILRMLASSPRFADMTVAAALEEIRVNGCGAPSVSRDYGHCDTCGSTCDDNGCTLDNSHRIALPRTPRVASNGDDDSPLYEV